jgi:hypothetical protein
LLLFSQTLTGKIETVKGEKIAAANIIIKDSVNGGIKEFVIAKNGQYSLTLKREYKKITVEAATHQYISEVWEIENPQKDKIYTHDFLLTKDETKDEKEIREVVIVGSKPIVIKEDTVKYNVASFRDGSERKIEDLIKKLPGIQVNEKSGEIRYKGKSVETVTLEGDNLFGSNYSLGTKNINVDMVEQVQAIENYSENPLLKGVEGGEKVSLNLKLKKGKMDFSGNLDYGSGFDSDGKQVFDINTNILGISKNYKSFATLNYNNIGVNHSPFDYFGFTFNPEQISEERFLAKKAIPETLFFSGLDDDSRTNFNNQIFGNYNGMFKIGKRISVKTNLYYIHDKIASEKYYENKYVIGDESFKTSDSYNIVKKPEQYRADLELKINTSKTSLLEYKFRVRQENITTPSTVLENNETHYFTTLNSKDFLLKNSLTFTKKFNKNKALQVIINQSINAAPQDFFISPAVFDFEDYLQNRQYSRFRKNYLNFQSVFMGSTLKTKYAFSAGGLLDKNPFKSCLYGISDDFESPENDFHNDLEYGKKAVFTTGSYALNLGKWKISPSYKLTFLNQKLDNNLTENTENQEDIIFEPSLSIAYKINNISTLKGTANYAEKDLAANYLYIQPIMTSNRSTQSNLPDLSLQKSFSYSLFYTVFDLYNQFHFLLGAMYSQNKGGFISDFDIQENYTNLRYFFTPKTNDNWNFNFMIEKYIPMIESTLRLRSDYSISQYSNIVNHSEIRDNKTNFWTSELFGKTAFDIPVNFENIFKFHQSLSQSEGGEKFINRSLNDAFKIILKLDKRWTLIFSSDYYVPDTKKLKENYTFLDTIIRFSPKNKKFDLSFYAKNLLDQKNFTQIQTTDYSTNIFQSNILPRSFMLNLSFSL